MKSNIHCICIRHEEIGEKKILVTNGFYVNKEILRIKLKFEYFRTIQKSEMILIPWIQGMILKNCLEFIDTRT